MTTQTDTHVEPGITLTEIAAAEIRRVMREYGTDLSNPVVRVGVQGAGYQQQYVLDLTDQIDKNDRVYESQGLRLVCKAGEVERLAGTRVDFRDSPEGRGFVFHRPPEVRSAQREREAPTGAPPRQDEVTEALRGVIDPEVGLNVVDLGLIYGLEIDERTVHVRLTMTTPACPMSETIMADAEQRILVACPGAASVKLELVWDPPWKPEMMSDQAKKTMGWRR